MKKALLILGLALLTCNAAFSQIQITWMYLYNNVPFTITSNGSFTYTAPQNVGNVTLKAYNVNTHATSDIHSEPANFDIYGNGHMQFHMTYLPVGTTSPAPIRFILTDGTFADTTDSIVPVVLTSPPYVHMYGPNGGVFQNNNNINVNWTFYNMFNLPAHIEYAPWGTTNYTLAGTAVDTNMFSFAAPPPGNYKIRVRCGSYSDSSSNPVHVIPYDGPMFNISSPSGGEIYYGGLSDTLKLLDNGGYWIMGDYSVKLIDSTGAVINNDVDITMLGNDYFGDASVERSIRINIPSTVCNSCRFVIGGYDIMLNENISDTSGVFSIRTKSVSGNVYYDINNNGTFDAGDAAYPYPTIVAETPGVTGYNFSDANGNYNYYTNYTGTLALKTGEPCAGTVSPAQNVVTFSSGPQIFTGKDFKIALPNGLTYNLGISCPVTTTGIAHANGRYLTITNTGEAASPQGTLTFTYNSALEHYDPSYGQPTAPASQTSNSVTYNIPPIGPCQTHLVNVYMQATAANNTVMEEIVTLNGYTQDGNPTNNADTFHVTVFSSFDPNDKTVDRDTIYSNELPVTEPLTYVVRFQNTGSAPAYNIRVIDTLSTQFDLSTFRMLSASHDFDLYTRPGNVTEWKFPNINLPDSTTDEPGSHGYVIFSILPKNNLTLGNEIENFVDIYFDYNEPVRTNTAITRVVEPLGLKEGLINAFSLQPNPANSFVQVNLKDKTSGKTMLKLYSADGRLLQTSTHYLQNSGTLIQDISTLANGFYYLGININGKETARKLVVIH